MTHLYKHFKDIHKQTYKKKNHEKRRRKKVEKTKKSKNSGGKRMKKQGNIFTCVFSKCLKYFIYNVVVGKIPTTKLVLKKLKGTFYRYESRYVNYRFPKRCIGRQVVSSNEHGVLGETFHTYLLIGVKSRPFNMTPLMTLPPPK